MPIIEDAHLLAAIDEVIEVISEAEMHHLTSQGSAWWANLRILERFLVCPGIAYPHRSSVPPDTP